MVEKREGQKETPESFVGTCHFLKVASQDKDGAFLEWGFPQGLFVPAKEQKQPLEQGAACIVYVYRNETTGAIEGSSRLDGFLWDDAPENARENDEVDLLIYARTDLGYKAIVNNDCWGVLYKNEVFKELACGQELKGFIRKIREDGRVDLCLQRPGYQGVGELSEQIVNHLKASGGSSSLTDKTPPEEIYRLFAVSKKKFKAAVGNLYRKRLITIDPEGIILAASLIVRGKKR